MVSVALHQSKQNQNAGAAQCVQMEHEEEQRPRTRVAIWRENSKRKTFNYGTPFMTSFPDDHDDIKSISFHPVDEPLLHTIVTTTCPTLRQGVKHTLRLPVKENNDKRKNMPSYDLSTIDSTLASSRSEEAREEAPTLPTEVMARRDRNSQAEAESSPVLQRTRRLLGRPVGEKAVEFSIKSTKVVDRATKSSNQIPVKAINSLSRKPVESSAKSIQSRVVGSSTTTKAPVVPTNKSSTKVTIVAHKKQLVVLQPENSRGVSSQKIGSETSGSHDSQVHHTSTKNNQSPSAYDMSACDDASWSDHASFHFRDEIIDEIPLLLSPTDQTNFASSERPQKAVRRSNNRHSLTKLVFSSSQLNFRRRVQPDMQKSGKYRDVEHDLVLPEIPVIRKAADVQKLLATNGKKHILPSKGRKDEFQRKGTPYEVCSTTDRAQNSIADSIVGSGILDAQGASATSQQHYKRTKTTTLSYDDLQARFDSESALHDELDQFVQRIIEVPSSTNDEESTSDMNEAVIVNTLRAPLDQPLSTLYEDDDEDSEIISVVDSPCHSLDNTIVGSGSKSLEDHFRENKKSQLEDGCEDDEGTGFLLGEGLLEADNPFSESSCSHRRKQVPDHVFEECESTNPYTMAYVQLLATKTESMGDDLHEEDTLKDKIPESQGGGREEEAKRMAKLEYSGKAHSTEEDENTTSQSTISDVPDPSVSSTYDSNESEIDDDLFLPETGSDLSALTDHDFPNRKDIIPSPGEAFARKDTETSTETPKRGGLLRSILNSSKEKQTKSSSIGKLNFRKRMGSYDMSEEKETNQPLLKVESFREKKDAAESSINKMVGISDESDDDEDGDPFRGLHCVTRMAI